MHDIVFFSYVSYRPEEHLHIGNKGNEGAKAYVFRDNSASAIIDDNSKGNGSEKLYDGHEDCKDPDLLHACPIIFMIQPRKIMVIFLFMQKKLDNLYSLNSFRNPCVYLSDFYS